MTAHLVLDGIHKSFGNVHVLDGVSFAAESGRCTLVEGPTGSGKSLLLRIAMQRVAPDAGTVRWFGQAIPPLTPAQRLRIACSGPGFNVDRLATVAEAMLGEGAFRGLHGPALRGRFHDLLEMCDLKPAEDRVIRGLSPTDQAIVQVASTMIGDPDVILLDEPIALVPEAFGRLAPMLREALDRGAAVVVLTANPAPWSALQPVRVALEPALSMPVARTAAPTRRAA